MTYTPNNQEPKEPKPYSLVSFYPDNIERKKPSGHHKYNHNQLTGKINLNLEVKNPVFIASGVVGMGRDISPKYNSIPLIKLAVKEGESLLIPGSSLKGVVRSVYEAITASCVCKINFKNKLPDNQYKECQDKEKLCPACRLFGAMNWQAIVRFPDAIPSKVTTSIGFLPSLYSPKDKNKDYYNQSSEQVKGRKFYYHAAKPANPDGGEGIPIEQVDKGSIFTIDLKFSNLTQPELGTLLIALGVVEKHQFPFNIGSGKPVGMGTIQAGVTQMQIESNLKSRYLTYDVETNQPLTGDKLKKEIDRYGQIAEQQLIKTPQLQQLKEIWKYPTNRKAPSGMY